jgi:4-hydroxyacetophenone monooxygenase
MATELAAGPAKEKPGDRRMRTAMTLSETASARDGSASLEADVDRAIADAHLPTLAVVLVHLTGDAGFLAGRQAHYERFGDAQGGFPEDFALEIRSRARTAIIDYMGGKPLPPAPGRDELKIMLDFIAGIDIPDTYLPYILEELKMDGIDPREPAWGEELAASAVKMKVLVIGAGMSGILAGVRLKQAGIPFEIVESNSDVGGVWFENTYPGCRVDSMNHMYAYSFAPGYDWPNWFSRQPHILKYFKDMVERFGLRDHLRLNTKVTEARFDEEAGEWTVGLAGADGTESEVVADAVISAVGQLNQPRYPSIAGQENFLGEAMHSARWRPGVDLKGKRVAVIGTGASGNQIIPEIAADVGQLYVFQRSPVWLTPQPNYHRPVEDGFKWLLTHLPFYEKWYRFHLFWQATEGLYDTIKRDPDWTGEGNPISLKNKLLADTLADRLRAQLVGAEHLIPHVIPDFPVGGKRTLRDNGVYLSALRRPNVEMTSDRIAEITANSIVTADGTEREVDVIIYATGFHASEFLRTIDVVGRGGRSLKEEWQGEARAYLGLTVPDFPNFFMLYGPNTNLVSNGSKFLFSECGVRFILECLRLVAEEGAETIEVRRDVFERYNDEIDEANALMAWAVPEVSNWYKNPTSGRVSQNWPFRTVEYWERTRAPRRDDFNVR